jgi:NADH-quinone oxidoreductase E subunit
MQFSETAQRDYEEILHHYPSKEAAVKTVLWLAQREFGTITSDVESYLSELMGVPIAQIHGVASFYTMFHKRSVGKYHIQVCHNLPCSLLGAEHLIDHLRELLNIEVGETTEDGLFTLSEVECLGSCGTAPMMQINGDYYESLTAEGVDGIIAKLRNGGAA